MLAHETAVGAIAAGREVLDRFGVADRLKHISEFVWRGGTLRFEAKDDDRHPPIVCYELRAQWRAAVYEPLGSPQQALTRAESPVVEGRWTRGTAGYLLRIGFDLAVPSAIFIHSDRPLSNVPFLHRPHELVLQALSADLAAYVDWFLDTCPPVPQAANAAAQQLRRFGLDV